MRSREGAYVTRPSISIKVLWLLCFSAAGCNERSFAVTVEDFSGAACQVGGLVFSIRDETKSISVNGGEGPHFTFKRGMTIGSGKISDIHSIFAEGDKVTVLLDDAYSDDPSVRRFEFRNLSNHCIREIKAIVKLLNLPK
jgi:hypothetical protein